MKNPLTLPTPLGNDKAALLDQLVEGLDLAALHWLSGYTAGLAANRVGPAAVAAPAMNAVAPEAKSAAQLTIIFGTQTGNSRHIVEKLKAQAEGAGVGARHPRRRLPDA